jgi:exosortase H (IPTLxxWG-CTERM-specific)
MKYSNASLSDKIKENRTLLTFGALFVFFCATFYAITRLTPSTFTPLNNYTTTTLGFLLQLLGMHPTVDGALLSAGGFSVKIIDGCSALFVFILFSSFVLAYPTTFKNKAIGLIFGIPSLFVVNTLRLTVVFFAGLWRPDLFEYVHAYLWQTIMIILVFNIVSGMAALCGDGYHQKRATGFSCTICGVLKRTFFNMVLSG